MHKLKARLGTKWDYKALQRNYCSLVLFLRSQGFELPLFRFGGRKMFFFIGGDSEKTQCNNEKFIR